MSRPYPLPLSRADLCNAVYDLIANATGCTRGTRDTQSRAHTDTHPDPRTRTRKDVTWTHALESSH